MFSSSYCFGIQVLQVFPLDQESESGEGHNMSSTSRKLMQFLLTVRQTTVLFWETFN